MRRVFPAMLALLAITLLGWSAARANYEITEVSRMYSHWEITYGSSWIGDHAVVANGANGLVVMDVGDPGSMAPVAALTSAGAVYAVAAQDDETVFVANGTAGLLVLDLSDPTDPTVLGQLGLSGTAQAIALEGSRAYLGYRDGNQGGVHVVDISLPADPVLLGSLPTASPINSITSHYPTLYATAGNGGLHLINVSDPSAPTALSSIANFVSARAVDVHGDYAYVADEAGLLSVIDVSDQSAPFPVNSISTLEGLSAVMLELVDDNMYAHVVDGGAFRTIDVTDPDNMFERASLAILPDFDNPCGMVRDDNRVLLSNGSNGISSLDISDLDNPVTTAEYRGMREVLDVAFAQHYAYVADGLDGLRMVDVHNISHPHEVSGTGHTFSHVLTPDSTKLVGLGQGLLVVFDLTDPDDPQQIGSMNFSGPGKAVTYSDGYLYIAAGTYGIYVVDITTWSNPVLVGTSGLPGNASADDLAVTANGLVVLSTGSGLHLYHVDTPDTPEWVTNWTGVDHPNAIAAKNGDVMVAWGEGNSGGLACVGVIFQGFFLLKDEENLGMPAVDVRLDENLALLSHLNDGISAWNTVDVYDLQFENSSATAASAHAVDFYNNLIFVADEQHLTIFQGGGATSVSTQPSVPVGFTLTPVYPNPFNAGATSTLVLPEASPVTVTLYDILGHQVRVLRDGQHAAGRYPVFVDGSALATGTYFLRVTGWSDAPQTQRITLIK